MGKEIEAALKTSWDLFDAVAADRTPVGERERRFDSWVVQQVVESTVKHFGRKAIAVADAAVLATVPVTLGFLAEMLTAVVFAAQDAKPESHVSFRFVF